MFLYMSGPGEKSPGFSNAQGSIWKYYINNWFDALQNNFGDDCR